MQTIQPAPGYTSFRIEEMDMVPWSEQFPKQYLEKGYLPLTPQRSFKDLLMPSFYQRADSLWVSNNKVSLSLDDHTLHPRNGPFMIPFGDEVVRLDVPNIISIDTIRPIRIERVDAAGTVLWSQETPAIPVNNNGYFALTYDDGELYFQFNLLEERQSSILWHIDPATGSMEEILKLTDNYSKFWIHEGIAYWQEQSMIVAYDLATHQQTEHAIVPELDMRKFSLITPLPNHTLFFVGIDGVLWTDQHGNTIAHHPPTAFIPADFDETTMKVDLNQAILQSDGSLLYPAVTEDGVHILRLTWQ